MTLKEIPSAFRLPKVYRSRVWLYALKKLIQIKPGLAETEANRILRTYAKVKGELIAATDTEFTWRLNINNNLLEIFCRRYPSSDLGIMNQVFGNKEYGPVLELFNTEESLRIVDAGANVGFSSLFFKTAFPNSKILCLEIDDANFLLLQRNISQNGFQNITTLKEALWKSNAFLEIKRDFRDKSECSYYVEESSSNTSLTGHSLLHYLSIMNWQKIDLLKIDIEGAERYLFETNTLADQILDNTRVLVIEIHDEFDVRKTIEEHLTRHGFTYFNHGDITIATRIKKI